MGHGRRAVEVSAGTDGASDGNNEMNAKRVEDAVKRKDVSNEFQMLK